MLSVPSATIADASIVLLVATCFPPQLVAAVCDMLSASLSEGATVVTVSKPFPPECAVQGWY
jgi:hypothetical protein